MKIEGLPIEQAFAMSRRFREGLLRLKRDGALKPNEFDLAELLCQHTFDVQQPGGRIDFDFWAKLLNLKDSKGYRPDQAEKLFQTLTELDIVDVNDAQATFEPRPDSSIWLRACAMRARALSPQRDAEGELPLRDERPLPEALNELSREAALAQPASCSQPSEKSDDAASGKLPDGRRRNPTTQETREKPRDAVSSEKSDDAPLRLKDPKFPKLKLRSGEITRRTGAELKSALYRIEETLEGDDLREAFCVILGESAGNNDAGKWINRRRSQPGIALQVFRNLVERMGDVAQKPVIAPARMAEAYWQRIVNPRPQKIHSHE